MPLEGVRRPGRLDHGGRPQGEPARLSYGGHYVDQDDVDAVVRVLEGSRLTQGSAVPRFEAALRRTTGAEHALAVTNGTVALELAYAALDVGPGARVLTSANTFLATATAALLRDAEVEFLDVDARTGNLDPDQLEAACAESVPDVVSVVHFAGRPCDMARILELKRRFGFRLVEDAAHALGARYPEAGRTWRVGEHPEVDATVLSFHPVKQITTGEGGAVLTPSPELAARIARLRNHGRDPSRGTPTDVPMVELGFNARMSDIHAALGASQLDKLPDFLAARREIAMRYIAELRGFELLDPGGPGTEHGWHLFVIHVDERDELLAHLARHGIDAQIHYHPVPHQPWFEGRVRRSDFPNAEAHGRRALSLPIHPTLTEADQARVVRALEAWRRERSAA